LEGMHRQAVKIVTWDLVYAKIYTHSDPGAEPSGGHGRLSPVRVLQVILHTNAR
jgi:hypothetical protein